MYICICNILVFLCINNRLHYITIPVPSRPKGFLNCGGSSTRLLRLVSCEKQLVRMGATSILLGSCQRITPAKISVTLFLSNSS